MADNTKKVTIDADYFAELYAKANEADEICKECKEEHSAEEFRDLVKERDELKAKLATSQNYEAVIVAKDREIAAVKEERNRFNAKVNELKEKLEQMTKFRDECERQLQEKCNELFAANSTNSEQADQLRDALNALEKERMKKCDEVTAKRLAAAERCINTIRGFHWETFEEIENLSQNIMAVILSYDKAMEAAR